MQDYYVYHATRRQTSRFDSNPYYELEMVTIDAPGILTRYKTYVVTVYENYDHWQQVIEIATQPGEVAWFSGDMKTKKWDPYMINADCVPRAVTEITSNTLEKFLQHHINIGAIKNTRVEREFNEVGKQFFDV